MQGQNATIKQTLWLEVSKWRWSDSFGWGWGFALLKLLEPKCYPLGTGFGTGACYIKPTHSHCGAPVVWKHQGSWPLGKRGTLPSGQHRI